MALYKNKSNLPANVVSQLFELARVEILRRSGKITDRGNLVKEESGEYTFFPAKFNDYPSEVDIAKAFIMQNFGHPYEGNSLDTFDGGYRANKKRKEFKDTWELAGDESELDIWPEIPEEYKDLDKKDLCPESCVSHDEDIPF